MTSNDINLWVFVVLYLQHSFCLCPYAYKVYIKLHIQDTCSHCAWFYCCCHHVAKSKMTGHQLLSGTHTHKHWKNRAGQETVVSDYHEAHSHPNSLTLSSRLSRNNFKCLHYTPPNGHCNPKSTTTTKSITVTLLRTFPEVYSYSTSSSLSFVLDASLWNLPSYLWNHFFLNLQSTGGVLTPAEKNCSFRRIFSGIQYYTGHRYYVISTEIMESQLRYHLSHVL